MRAIKVIKRDEKLDYFESKKVTIKPAQKPDLSVSIASWVKTSLNGIREQNKAIRERVLSVGL